MSRSMVLYVLCLIMRVEAATMIPALLIALCSAEQSSALAFALSIAALAFSSLATLFRSPRKKSISARTGFVIVASSWIVVSVYGCLPFILAGYIPNFMDALFETISGFTTTGATILTDVEALPKSLLYWRSFTHWLGGMGVLVLVLAIVPMTSRAGSTINLLRAESPGPIVDKLVPRMGESAKILYAIYIGLTALQFLLLLAGGLSVFESITTAYGTAGTGGFGVLNDSLASYSPYVQNVVTVFMILFGINFNIFYLLIIRDYVKILHSSELWTYLGILLLSILLIAWNTLGMYQGFRESFHHAALQVASIMTTTGFASVDFNLWPEFSKMILVLLMCIGACAGSTGGGIKTARVIILFKSFLRNLKHLQRPRSVSVVRVGGRPVDEDVIQGTQAYLGAYILILGASFLLLSIDNFSFETTTTAVIACLNNIGPGLDVVGPTGNYAAFSNFGKAVLSADMLIGRLEIYPMLMLFLPSVYKG